MNDEDEVSIMSNAFWVREQALIRLKSLQADQQIQQIKASVQEAKFQDKIQREKESRVIGRYFSVKTDVVFQRSMTLQILENLLQLYKKAISEYQAKKLVSETQFLRRDMDKLKLDIAQVLQESKNNMSQTLTYISKFSRTRFESNLRLFEDQLMRLAKKTTEIKESPPKEIIRQTIIPPQFKIVCKNIKTTPQRQPETQKQFASDSRFDIMDADPNQNPFAHMKNNSIFNYYQCIFKRHQARKAQCVTESINTLQQDEPTEDNTKRISLVSQNSQRTQNIVSQLQTRIERIEKKSNYILKQQNSLILERKVQGLDYDKYTSLKKTKYPTFLEHELTCIEKDADFACQNYYMIQKNELKTLSESEQKTFLYKIYKDLLKQNTYIQNSQENFRINYLKFLHRKQNKSQTPNELNRKNLSRSPLAFDTKFFWGQQYIVAKQLKNTQQKLLNSFDYKDIKRMYDFAFESQTKRVSHSPDQHSRFKTDYLQLRPMTNMVQTRKSDLNFTLSPHHSQSAYHKKNGSTKPLNTTHYDH